MKKFIFILLAVSILLPSTVVLAQNETKISATWKIAVVRSDKINISGKENHTLALTEYKILSETVEDGTPFGQFKEGVIYGIEDLIQGTGSQEGYNKIKYGDMTLIPEWSGKVTTSPSGAVTSEGTWGFVGGPFVGGGTYSGRFISPKEAIIEWEGEYHKK